jgi:hypothetical protein
MSSLHLLLGLYVYFKASNALHAMSNSNYTRFNSYLTLVSDREQPILVSLLTVQNAP